MNHANESLQIGIELAAVLVTGYFFLTMWKRRTEPTARQLLAVATLAFGGANAHVVVRHPNPVRGAIVTAAWSDAGSPLWVGVAMLVVILAGGFWLLFALEYTGRGGRLIPLTTGAIGVFWVLVVGFALFGDFSPPAEAQMVSNLEVTLFLGMFTMTVAMIVGALLVLSTSFQRNAVRFREGLTLAGGASLFAFIPTASNTLQDPVTVPAMLSVATGLLVVSIHRYPTFEAPPVARIAGRDRLIEEMDDPFVVVDGDEQIRDVNPAGERYFDVDRDAVLGDSLDVLLPSRTDPVEVVTATDPVRLKTATGNTLAVTANQITDARDRSFGHLLVCRDVTDRRRRERRLAVLNQLLTGAVGDQMREVADETAEVAGADDAKAGTSQQFERVGSAVNARATGLLDLVARTREVERALSGDGVGHTEIVSVIGETIDESVSDNSVETRVEADGPVFVAVDADVLTVILEILVDDAVEHARDTVEIAVVESDRAAEIHVSDDRSVADASGGVDDAVSRLDGRETRSDLSVEMVRLAAGHVSGDVSIRFPDTGGRRATVVLPGADSTTGEGETIRTETGIVERADLREGGDRR